MASDDLPDVLGVELLNAMITRDELTFIKLVEIGCPVNFLDNLKKSPLILAIEGNNLHFMKLLLHYKADPNMTGFLKVTPLHIACARSNVEAVSMLLAYGADPTLTSIWDEGPIHCTDIPSPCLHLLQRAAAGKRPSIEASDHLINRDLYPTLPAHVMEKIQALKKKMKEAAEKRAKAKKNKRR